MNSKGGSTVNLQRGDTGGDVLDLQKDLNRIGIKISVDPDDPYPNGAIMSVPEDGDFGPRTERAVRAFQEGYGLTVDGVAGPKTLKALKDRPGPDRCIETQTREINKLRLDLQQRTEQLDLSTREITKLKAKGPGQEAAEIAVLKAELATKKSALECLAASSAHQKINLENTIKNYETCMGELKLEHEMVLTLEAKISALNLQLVPRWSWYERTLFWALFPVTIPIWFLVNRKPKTKKAKA